MTGRVRVVARHPAVWMAGLLLVAALSAHAHEGAHGDPELLGHWRTQVHLLFQWAHLVAFGFWLGGMLAATRLPALSLESLLFASWALFLRLSRQRQLRHRVQCRDAGRARHLFAARSQGRWEFGDAYIVLVGAKQALLVLAVAWTAMVTVAHLRRPRDEGRERLRRRFVTGSIALGLTLAAVAAMVLVLHEAVDLAPTPLHPLAISLLLVHEGVDHAL